jgi:hypothetical protein
MKIEEQGSLMSARTRGYGVGIVAGAAVGWLARSSEVLSEFHVWLALLIMAAVVLVTEIRLGIARRASFPRLRKRGRRGPNRAGLVSIPITPLEGVASTPNLRDPRFHHYLGTPSSSDESSEPTQIHANPRGRRSPDLVGRWAVVSLFVGCDGRPWAESEIAERMSALRTSCQWIAKEADRWEADLDLSLCATYFTAMDDDNQPVGVGFALEGHEVGPVEWDALTRTLILASRCARQIGFHDAAEMTERIGEKLGDARAIWIVHPRKAGRSIAIPLEISELPGVSLALCYAQSASFPESIVRVPRASAATFAHEILHLFGASDKYGRFLDEFPPGTVTPAEIMRLDRTRLDQLRVDPLTAAEIGWLGDLPPDETNEDANPTRNRGLGESSAETAVN